MTRSKMILAAFAASSLSGVTATASASAPPGSSPTGSEPMSSAPACSTDAVSGDLLVFAAASLTDSFTSIGDAFMTANPDSDVTFNFGASSDLVGSINEGAVADIFASADQNNMDKLTAPDGEGTIGEPVTFATNTLEIIVEPGNPKGITGLADLANRGPDGRVHRPGGPDRRLHPAGARRGRRDDRLRLVRRERQGHRRRR